MKEYEVLYKNLDDGNMWLSKGVYPGIKGTTRVAHETFREENKYARVVVKIVSYADGTEYVVVVK